MISKYNMYHKNEYGYIIYNILTRKVKKISFEIYNSLLNNDEKSLTEKDKEILAMDGYIVDDNTDEYSCLMDKYYRTIYEDRLELTVMASTTCNFKCQYCYEDFKPATIDNEFVEVMTKFIKKNVMNYHGVNIEWFGGEPLLAKDRIIELSSNIGDVCKKARVPYISSITTNGYLLDLDTFSKLLKSGVRYFQITIDGNEETHNKLRPLKNGGNTYKVIFDNLKSIKSNALKFSYFSLVIRNNVYEGNKLQVKDFVNTFEREFGDDDRFKILQYTIKDWGGDNISSIKDELLDEDKTIKFEENKFSYSEIDKDFSAVMCLAAKENGLVIDPELNLYKCSHYIQDKKCKYKSNRAGVINKKGDIIVDRQVTSSWNIRKIHDDCKKCAMLPSCLIETCPLKDIYPKESCVNNVIDNIKNNLDLYYKLKEVKK